MDIIKDDILELEITGIGMNGEGVGRVDGVVVFVPYALKSERVRAKVAYVNKKYVKAVLVEVIDKSPARITPQCKVFTRCGGCDLQHIAYETQLDIKTKNVDDVMNRLNKLNVKVEPCIASPKLMGYRNKLQLPIAMRKGKVELGFYSENTHKVIPIDSCPQSSWSGSVISAVKNWANDYNLTVYDETTEKGLLRHVVAREVAGRIMITLVVTSLRVPHIDKLIEYLDKHFTDYTLYLNLNDRATNVITGDKLELVKGDKALIGETLGIKYALTPLSFAQVNTGVTELIYRQVADAVGSDETVVDAYSGIGVMSCMIAKKAAKVYGIEIVRDAVNDANETAKMNGLDKKVINVCGDCAEVLPDLIKKVRAENTGNITVVLDPPRKGCDERVLSATIESKPNKIIYVSCNPATLARDLCVLTGGGEYKIDTLQPYDMFPLTRHVETVTVLSYKNTRTL